MKYCFSIALMILFSMIIVGQTSFQKIAREDVSQTALDKASDLAEKILLGQKSGNYYMLDENEAMPEVVRGLTPAVQESSYSTIQSMFGDFESLEFEECWSLDTEQGAYQVYRFKGQFSEHSGNPEIRVVLNKTQQLSGFWVRPWTDNLQGNP